MSRKVIAYEDDPELRRLLETVFSALQPEYQLLATFPNPLRVLAEVNEYKPDVVLMDLQMLDVDDGLLALYKIKQTVPEVKVLVLTMFDTDQKIFNALCLEADGYMLKTEFSSTQQLPHQAMRKSLATIFEGGAYLTPSVARQIMKLFTDHSLSERMNRVKERFQLIFQKEKDRKKYREAGLTPMQTAVLGKIIDGKSTAQAAHELDIKEATVYTHIKAIYSILGVHSRAMLIRKTMQQRGHI